MKVKFFSGLIDGLNQETLFLKFKNIDSQERDFRDEYLSRSIKFSRFSLILGLLFYSVFGFLDALIIPEQKYSIWFIRFAVVNPVLIILIFLSFQESLKKYIEIFGVIALIVAGSGISVMVAISPPPASYSYYSGIILVLMLGYGLLRIRFKWASFAGWLNVLIYEIIAVFVAHTPSEILINNNFFFISANLIGMFSSYAIEYYIRRNYIFAKLLETEQDNVKNLNKNLENRVKERTSELSHVNNVLLTEIDARNSAEQERTKLEKQLFQSRKMESLGNFAGGIAHDFNNILTSILGYSELSLDIADNAILISHLEMIRSSGIRASELVSQILSFARKSEKKIEPVRPDLILREVLKLIRSSIPATIQIKQNIESSAYIMGNPAQIHQIFMNLITNSVQAMKEEGGILDISIKNIQMNRSGMTDTEINNGKYIRIIISDSGVGISPELITSVFEPYFTTKNIGEGTGLGLAVVHGIIESYGGDISVASDVGKGSRFIINLPETEVKAMQTYSGNIHISGGNERILLLDDEPAIAESGKLILSSLGYKVTSMTDSLDALDFFKSNPFDFDLIITDMMMPHMNGFKFADKISAIRADVPVIICSGYGKESSGTNRSDQKRSFLDKPYSKSEIALEVRNILDN